MPDWLIITLCSIGALAFSVAYGWIMGDTLKHYIEGRERDWR